MEIEAIDEAMNEVTIININTRKKLQKARALLSKKRLKRSGAMNIGGKIYRYFELKDIQPSINSICDDLGLYLHFDIKDKESELLIYDTDNDSEPVKYKFLHEKLVILEANPQKNLQAMGSKITYINRYFLKIAFQIAEDDITEPMAHESRKQIANPIDAIKAARDKKNLPFKKAIQVILDLRGIIDIAGFLNSQFPEQRKAEDYKAILDELKKQDEAVSEEASNE